MRGKTELYDGFKQKISYMKKKNISKLTQYKVYDLQAHSKLNCEKFKVQISEIRLGVI